MSAFALFYSASSYEQLDLIYFSPSAKLQNPPEGKVPELFHSKVGDFPPANLRGNRPNLHWSSPPIPIFCDSTRFYGSAALPSNSFYEALPTAEQPLLCDPDPCCYPCPYQPITSSHSRRIFYSKVQSLWEILTWHCIHREFFLAQSKTGAKVA